MKRKLTFDKEKYIRISIWKLLLLCFISLFAFLIIMIVNRRAFTMTDWKFIILIITFFEFCYGTRLFLNYKYYKNNFECKYNQESLVYDITRFSNIFESLFNILDSQTVIHLEVSRLDKVEKKFGRIYLYGKMTEEKTIGKTKVKILKKYSFPDYCIGEEELMNLINK